MALGQKSTQKTQRWEKEGPGPAPRAGQRKRKNNNTCIQYAIKKKNNKKQQHKKLLTKNQKTVGILFFKNKSPASSVPAGLHTSIFDSLSSQEHHLTTLQELPRTNAQKGKHEGLPVRFFFFF